MTDELAVALAESLCRIEHKLDLLLEALAGDEADDESAPLRTLDGHIAGADRDQSQPL